MSKSRWIVRLTWMYGAAALLSIGLVIAGAIEQEWAIAGLGTLGLVIVLAVAPLSFASAMRPQATPDQASTPDLDSLRQSIERLGELSALSDDARRVLNRQRERDLLCRAIEEDIESEDWDAALVLCKELAERFGYRVEAEDFRGRIETARFETVDHKVGDAIAHLDGLIIQRRWTDAFAEAGRIGRLYPESPRVEGLRHRVEQARALYKQEVERRFLHAAQQNRVDEAMELLQELDQYLTPDEGARYMEVARGVIGKARENLGVQFKLAVQDRQWRRASEVGQRIVEQFPNTRMADEIREVIDSIRAKAQALNA